MNCFADTYAVFNDDQIKLISVCPFFMNNFSLCGDDAYAYFGKPIIELTNFQISLLNTAKYTKSLILLSSKFNTKLVNLSNKIISSNISITPTSPILFNYKFKSKFYKLIKFQA